MIHILNRRLPLALALVLATLTTWSAAAARDCALVVNGAPLVEARGLISDAGDLLLSEPVMLHALGLAVVPNDTGDPWSVRAFGRSVRLRAGARQYMIGEDTLTARSAALLRDDGLAVPLEMLAKTFGIEAVEYRDGEAVIWSLATTGAQIMEVRDGAHRDRIRLVVDLDRPTCFTWWSEPGRLVIETPSAACRRPAHRADQPGPDHHRRHPNQHRPQLPQTPGAFHAGRFPAHRGGLVTGRGGLLARASGTRAAVRSGAGADAQLWHSARTGARIRV
jgi:hypothetical protein